jgi:hypothetical protein
VLTVATRPVCHRRPAATAAQVAAQLAGIVNQRAGAGFKATSQGATLAIVNTVGIAFGTGFRIGGTPAGTVTEGVARTTVVDLNGTPRQGEVWTVTLHDGSVLTVLGHEVVLTASLGIGQAPLAGDTWTVALNDDPATTFSVVLDAAIVALLDEDLSGTVSLAELAQGLANAVNLYTPSVSDFRATAAGADCPSTAGPLMTLSATALR